MKTVLAVVLALGSLSACDKGPLRVGQISRSLGRAVGSDISLLHIANYTTFGWDEMFIFQPHTPRAEMCTVLGVKQFYCSQVVRAESEDENEMTLAFRKGKRVTHVELHSRRNGDFMQARLGVPIQRDKAVFRVVSSGPGEGGHVWYRLLEHES